MPSQDASPTRPCSFGEVLFREGFNASSDAVMSTLIKQLAAVLNADPDRWGSHQKLLREIVGGRAERLTERAERAISTK